MTEKLKIPKKVIESDWKDDIADENDSGPNKTNKITGLEYEPFKGEADFVSPDKALSENTQEAIDRIKARKIGIASLSLSEITKSAA